MVAVLDLHGHTVDQAERRLDGFLRVHAVREPGEVVRVVTGRGVGAGTAPVVQEAVRTALGSWAGEWISDWSVDAGGGAFLLRLRG